MPIKYDHPYLLVISDVYWVVVVAPGYGCCLFLGVVLGGRRGESGPSLILATTRRNNLFGGLQIRPVSDTHPDFGTDSFHKATFRALEKSDNICFSWLYCHTYIVRSTSSSVTIFLPEFCAYARYLARTIHIVPALCFGRER